MDPYCFTAGVLECGSRVYYRHLPECNYVRFGIRVKVGSLQDPARKEGLAHLFEHLVFGGTERYPNDDDIEVLVEELGGSFNANTNIQRTLYFVELPVAHTVTAWDCLEQMVFYPLLSQATLDRERLIIFNEINRAEEKASWRDVKRFFDHMYGSNHAEHCWVLGWPETLERVSLQDVQAFHVQYNVPENCDIVMVGNLTLITPDPVTWLNDRWQHWGTRATRIASELRPGVMSVPSQWRSYYLPIKSPRFEMSGPLHRSDKPDVLLPQEIEGVADIATTLLGGRSSLSLLQKILRKKLGLVYGISSVYHVRTYMGEWEIRTTVNSEADLLQVQEVIDQVLTDPASFSDENIESVKSTILGRYALTDHTPGQLFRYAIGSLTDEDRIVSKSELLQRVVTPTAEEVRQFVAWAFAPSNRITITYLP